MQIETRNVHDLVPYENNPRLNADAIDAVAASIKAFGFKVPIVVDRDGVIITGHTRREAALRLNLEEVPVIVADDLTEDQVRAFRLADNKVSELATWDEDALQAELDALTAADFDLSDFGFDIDEAPTADDYSDDFTLPNGERPEMCTCTFTLHYRQKELIDFVLAKTPDDAAETYGNTNRDGNALYAVVKAWAEQKKLKSR